MQTKSLWLLMPTHELYRCGLLPPTSPPHRATRGMMLLRQDLDVMIGFLRIHVIGNSHGTSQGARLVQFLRRMQRWWRKGQVESSARGSQATEFAGRGCGQRGA